MKSQEFNLIFKHWWVINIFVNFFVEVRGFGGTRYMVSRVHGT